MDSQKGRARPTDRVLSPSATEPEVSALSGNAPSRDEFCARFKAYMLSVAGPTFDDGDSIADCADEAAPTYFETDWQREAGPEACASDDMSYWGD